MRFLARLGDLGFPYCAQEWDKLWSTNKRIIDPVCPRHVAVKSDGRVKLRLNNGPAEPEVVNVPKHKKNPDVGTKATTRTKVGACCLYLAILITLLLWPLRLVSLSKCICNY